MRKPVIVVVLVLALIALAIKAATPPATRIYGSPYNSPHFDDPPEFCSVIKQNVEGGTGVVAANTDFVMHYAQRFVTASNYNVCRIYLKCAYSGSPGTNTVRVSIYSHNSAGDGEPDAPLGTSTPVACVTMPTSTSPHTNDLSIPWTRFDIAPVSLVSGTTYWIVAYEPKASIFTGNLWHWFVEVGSAAVPNNEMRCDANIFPATPWISYNDNTRFKYRLQGQEPL